MARNQNCVFWEEGLSQFINESRNSIPELISGPLAVPKVSGVAAHAHISVWHSQR
jgi:hypothetical protein